MGYRLFAATAILCILNPAFADDRKDIEVAVQRFAKAFRAKDMAGVEAVTTADFSEMGPHGEKTGPKETKALYRQMWGMMRSIEKLEFKQESIKVTGPRAEAVYRVTISSVMPSPTNPKETQSMTSKGKSKLWLVKQKGAWKIQMSAHTGEAPPR